MRDSAKMQTLSLKRGRFVMANGGSMSVMSLWVWWVLLRADLVLQFMQFKFEGMECLRCPACSTTYSDSDRQERLPRVLIGCGHTFCQACITAAHSLDRVICLQCTKVSSAATPSSLPVNETLLALMRSQHVQQEHLCKTHRKKLEAFCEKERELICMECSLSTHRYHKACLISEKAHADRAVLKDSLKRIGEGYEESRKAVEKLVSDEGYLQSCFLDLTMEISVFYKQIIETVAALQQKEEESLKREKQVVSRQIQQLKGEAFERQKFHEDLQVLYRELEECSDIEFLQRENQQSFILSSSKSKRDKYVVPPLEFKRVGSLQEIIGQMQEMVNFQKKKIIHSSSFGMPNKDPSAIHGSPSLKKQGKEPAVLEVNLSQEYNRRKANMPKQVPRQVKKPKPAKKVISISTDKQKDKMMKEKEKIIEAVVSGRNVVAKDGKPDLRFIRESSIKKSRESDSLFYDDLDNSQNFTPMSINSFMRTSRQSQVSIVHLNDSSIKNSFNSFSLLQTEEKIFHFGGRTQSVIERYNKESHSSQPLNAVLHRKGMQAVHHKAYSPDKCLIFGGVTNTNNQLVTQILEFNFKTERVAMTQYSMPQPRVSFGCLSKEGALYIIGGRQQKPLNTFQKWEFGLKELQTTKLPNMLQTREDLGCCLGYDGFIYVAGGVNASNNVLNSCQRYNWHKKCWETVPHMNRQRRSFTLVALPHGIVAIGGHSSLKLLPFVEILDFNRWEWIELTPLNEARCYHSAIASKDYQSITVFGGFAETQDLDSIEIYDIESNSWTNGGRMKQGRCLHASIQSS